jgi:hypothetical protein
MNSSWHRRSYTKKEFRSAVASSASWEGVARKLDLARPSSTWEDDVRFLDISTEHFQSYGQHLKKPIDQLLVSNKIVKSSNLRKRLINEGIKEYRCETCGNSEWMGEDIPLELHHINGDRKDNRLCNLRILCPNCHAQNTVFQGGKQWKRPHNTCIDCKAVVSKRSVRCRRCSAKNIETINWPSLDELEELVSEFGGSAVARRLGTTHSAISQRIRRHKKLDWT